jgi:hypothetical protein
MRIGLHGGMCCGIKHIFELGNSPDNIVPAKTGGDKKIYSDVNYTYESSELNFFYKAAPEETYLKRFDRYLKFLEEERPAGIVEVSLVTPGTVYTWTQAKWVPVITERGFKEVTPEGGVYNSNSGNKVRVFHLYMERK